MAHDVICRAGVLHFNDAEPSAGSVLLVLGDRRPSAALIDALLAAPLGDADPLSVVRVATPASAFKHACGAPSPRADLEWALGVASARGAPCKGAVLRDVSFPAGVIRAVRRAQPGMVCVVPSVPEHSRAMRRALTFVGRLVDGQLAVVNAT
jgi:hypothetical protein